MCSRDSWKVDGNESTQIFTLVLFSPRSTERVLNLTPCYSRRDEIKVWGETWEWLNESYWEGLNDGEQWPGAEALFLHCELCLST